MRSSITRTAAAALSLSVASVALGGGDACCLPDGSCFTTDELVCTNEGGTYVQGLSCNDADCPANDDCDDRITIEEGVFFFDTTLATTDGPVNDCFDDFLYKDLWFNYTASADGTLVVSTCGSDFDTVLALYGGHDCPPTIELTCNDDACGPDGYQSNVSWSVTAGQRIKIQAGGYDAGEYGPLTITVKCVPADVVPPNDDCDQATPVGLVVDLPFQTINATLDGPGSCQDEPNIWYCFTSPCDGDVTVDLCGSAYDTYLAVYDGCDPIGALLGCNDDSGGLCSESYDSEVTFTAVAGQSYKIEVGAYDDADFDDVGCGDLTILCVDPPSGACCTSSGCEDIDANECAILGGTFIGAGTGCVAAAESGDPCEGACCSPTGICVIVTEDACNKIGGVFGGVASNCGDITCVTGACCLPGGACFDLTEAGCESEGGAYQGDGSFCVDNLEEEGKQGTICPAPGACCFADGSCQELLPPACSTAGGAYQGEFTQCGKVECPVAATGACCLDGGVCVITGFGGCAAQGGEYQGDDTVCTPNPCFVPTGACCIAATGDCISATGLQCVAAGGAFQGVGVLCSTVACPQPAPGACCLLDGVCISAAELECLVQGGVPQGEGTACPAGCPTVADDDRGNTTEKGSFFILGNAELRWDGGVITGAEPTQDTFISLTNDANEDVRVQMYFVNGDAPLDAVFDDQGQLVERAHPGWNWLDNEILLTANQPVYWSLNTGAPLGLSPFTALDPGDPPGRPAMDGSGARVLRGFIVGWAVNADGGEIRWNHLAANATVVDYANGLAWEYQSRNYAVVSGVAEGQPADATPGEISLDGAEYQLAAAMLMFHFQAAGSPAFGAAPAPRQVISDTDLTLVPLTTDLRQTNVGPVTTKADLTIWNQNEVKFSGLHRCLTCFDQTLISRYDLPNHFIVGNLQTQHGKARIDGVSAPLQCDDPLEKEYSRKAALEGVAARIMVFDPGMANEQFAAAGYNLVGIGLESAQIDYDLVGGSQEAEAQDDLLVLPPFGATSREIRDFIDRIVEDGRRR